MCNCYERVSSELRKSNQVMIGIVWGPELNDPSGLAFLTAQIIASRKGAQRQGLLYANFCPFCGAVLRRSIITVKGGDNGKGQTKDAAGNPPLSKEGRAND